MKRPLREIINLCSDSDDDTEVSNVPKRLKPLGNNGKLLLKLCESINHSNLDFKLRMFTYSTIFMVM